MKANKPILLVEDNPDDAFIFTRILKAAGITAQVKVVVNGQQAMDYLTSASNTDEQEKHPLPMLVFLDLKLPYVDGFEVLSWMRKQPSLRTMPVAVLSGSAESRDQLKATTLGAQFYLVKPPEAEILSRVLKSAVDGGPV